MIDTIGTLEMVNFSDERDPSNVYDDFGYYGVSLTVSMQRLNVKHLFTIPIELLILIQLLVLPTLVIFHR